ncbi:type II toxin-antitoxin system RelE/ParE family toxin [Pelagerythrobacter marensis]|uniref:Type II toxin-antitoxin system RelE/ParE family toxin n=1 Tax=Pelagerythrobacter marensis TaxID=543877 RepID=A0ABZ2D1B2_9SPHN
MTGRPVVWRPRARADLLALYDWIAERADPDTAFAYTSGIEACADRLATFPERGTPRDDLVAGMRTRPYRGRTVIAYRVVDGAVEILRLVHAGQNWDDAGEEGEEGAEG